MKRTTIFSRSPTWLAGHHRIWEGCTLDRKQLPD